MTLRTRLFLLIIAIVIFSTVVVAVQVYEKERARIFQQFNRDIDVAGVGEVRWIQGELSRVSRDLMTVAAVPVLKRYIETFENAADQSQAQGREYWRQAVLEMMTAFMQVNPEFMQLRVIGIANEGRELARINRNVDELEIVDREHLQRKAHRDYFQATTQLEKGQIFLSKLDLNREFGEIEVPHRPTFRLATPLFNEQGQLFGIVAINVDGNAYLNGIGMEVKRIDPEGRLKTYLAAAYGAWLIHPDPSFTFGPDLGTGHTLEHDEPLLFRFTQESVATVRNGADQQLNFSRHFPGVGLVHLTLIPAGKSDQKRYLKLIHVLPDVAIYQALQSEIWPVLISAILLGFLLLFPILGFVSRQIQPLSVMTNAASHVAAGDYAVVLPSQHASDEVGKLGQAFSTLVEKVQQREMRLQESQTYLERVLGGLAQGVLVVDSRGRIQRVNPALLRMFGYAEDELVGKSVDILVPAQVRQQHQQDRLGYNEKPREFFMGRGRLLRGQRSDGTLLPVEIGITPLRMGDRQLAIATVADISERITAEEKIRQLNSGLERRVAERTAELEDARRRTEMATDAAGIGIWMYDIPSGQLRWDDWMFRLYGRKPESTDKVIYETWSDSLHPDDRQQAEAQFQDALDGKAEFNTEFRIVWSDGSTHWIKANATVIYDDRGDSVQIIGTNRDISAAKQSAAAMVEARDAAERAARAKSDFLANMSHEIRTPINGVVGMTELLLDTKLTDEQLSRTRAIKSSANALLAIINDILDFSKIEAGKLDIEPIQFDLEELVADMAASLAIKAHEKKIELLFPDGVLPEHGSLQFTADAGRIRQVLTNLIGNAIKFTAKGEVCVHLTVEEQNEKTSRVRFDIRDTGIGIAPEVQSKLFERFTQGDASTTRTHGGTGLGLSISHQLVELMGGQIGVESTLGRGSNFWFSLDLEKAPIAAEPLWEPPKNIKGERVLVVDDNAKAREMLSQLFGRWAMDVDVVDNAPQALQMLLKAPANRRYKLVVIDQHMPGMDGAELEQAIRSDDKLRKMATILMRSPGSPSDDAWNESHDQSVIVDKPLQQSNLAHAIGILFGKESMSSIRPSTAQASKACFSGRVLVVEDNPVNQMVAQGLLERICLDVDIAENGQKAIDMLATTDYNLVFMDVHMPVLDGYEATLRIRDPDSPVRNHKVPIVAMTANAIAGEREKCLAVGMNEHLPKPIDIARLVDVLNKHLINSEGACEPMSAENDEEEQMDETDVFDSAALLERLFGEQALVLQIIDMYLNDAPKKVAELENVVGSGDFDAISRAAHAIKGAALSISAGQVVAAAAAIEEAGWAKDQATIDSHFSELQQAHPRLLQALADYTAKA